MELQPFIQFYSTKQQDRLLADPLDTSFNLNYTINTFFNSLSGDYQRTIAKLLFDSITPSNQTFGKDILSPEIFTPEYITNILYLVLYWETNIGTFLAPPFCNSCDAANHLCSVDNKSSNQYPVQLYYVYNKNYEFPEYSSVRRTYQFKPITSTGDALYNKDSYGTGFDEKSTIRALYNPMCDESYDRWMDEYHVNDYECQDSGHDAEYCHPEARVCVQKCVYGLHPQTEGDCICVTNGECARESCPAGSGFSTDPDYQTVVNAFDDSSFAPTSTVVGLATVAGNGVIKDYYSSLTNSPMLFYYAQAYTDEMSISPNRRFRLNASNELQAYNEFNMIRNYVMRGYSVYLTDSGLVYVSTEAGGKKEYSTFDLSEKYTTYTLSSSNGPDVHVEIDFNDRSKKQRWISSNGLFFVEVNVAINRISIYFNLFNSSVFCHLFLIDNEGTESYNQQLSTLFTVYQAYCQFIKDSDFFVNQKMCPCFDNDYCLQQIIPVEEQDAVRNTIAYYTLFCVVEGCVQLYSKDLSPMQLKLNTCPKSIDICINNINASNSQFTNVNLNTNCGNQCGSGCLSGFLCVNGQCVQTSPTPEPTPSEPSRAKGWLWFIIGIVALVMLIIGIGVIMYWTARRKI